jgi:hypothetical protein
MNIDNLRLTLTGRGFCMMPLSKWVDTVCTGDAACGCAATHRLLSRRTASVELLCDVHAESWSRDQTLGDADPMSRDGSTA